MSGLYVLIEKLEARVKDLEAELERLCDVVCEEDVAMIDMVLGQTQCPAESGRKGGTK